MKGSSRTPGRTGTIVAGGGVLEREGYFVQPTIVRDIPDDARLVREEQFGPVLPVLRFTDIDDVVARANDTDFGLGGSVWSSDHERGVPGSDPDQFWHMVWVNKHPRCRSGHSVCRALASLVSGSRWAGRDSRSSPRRPSSTWRNNHSRFRGIGTFTQVAWLTCDLCEPAPFGGENVTFLGVESCLKSSPKPDRSCHA